MAAKDLQWFQEKLEIYPKSTQHNEDLITFLNEVKLLSRETRKEYVHQLVFEPMFDLVIKWNNPVYADPFFELINLVFECMKASEVVTKFEIYLRKFIDHVSNRFQDLVFKVLDRVITEEELETLTMHYELTLAAARVLADRSLDHATPCLKFLTRLAHIVPHGTNIVFTGEIGDVLKHYVDVGTTIRFRIYEIVTSVANESTAGLALMQECGLLQELYDSMLGPTAHVDQVGYANTVETYKRMRMVPHSYDFLVSSGAIAKLQEKIVEYGPGTMEDKVMPTLFEFFGDLFAVDPEKIAKDAPDVVPTMLKLILVPMDRIHITRAEMLFIGQVATLPAGKLYLAKQNHLLPVLEMAGNFMKNGLADNKTLALEFTEGLIFLMKKDQTPEMLQLTQSWFNIIIKNVKCVWDFCIEPYPDIARTSIQVLTPETIMCRQQAMQFLAVLSTQPWGRQIIADTPGLLEWMIDRAAARGIHASTGSGGDPDVLRAKFAVIKNMMDHSDTKSLVNPEITSKLEQFLKEGPIYMKGVYEVAMEGAQ